MRDWWSVITLSWIDPMEAIYQACIIRFRPIMMTTMAALFGAIPLALSTGTGSELRRPPGIAVVNGLLLSQVLTLHTTPVIYLALERLRLRAKAWRKARGEGRAGQVMASPKPAV